MKKPTPTIIWLHSHFLYWMGGTKFIFEVVKRLPNYRVIVVVEQASELAREKYQAEGIELIELGGLTSTSPWYWLSLPLMIWQLQQQLQHLIQTRRLPQTTLLLSSMFPMNVVASGLPFTHFQLCYEPFAFFYDREFTKSFSWLKRLFITVIGWWGQPLDKGATRKAAHLFTLNRVTQELIKDVYGCQASLVYAGVDTDLFKSYVNSKLEKKYQNQKVVIHSTDYSPVKGTDRVIKAMASVCKKVPTATLVITSTISNPTAEEKLRQLAVKLGIGPQVEFAGFVSIEQLPQYYSLAQVLVQGSNSARSGTTSMALPVKESMSCQTPVIRPDVGGEDVVDGISGFLVDPANTSLLAKKILFILQHPKEQRKMGLAARKKIMHTYTWEKTVERFTAYFPTQ